MTAGEPWMARIAVQDCVQCAGQGVRHKGSACLCVLRRIARDCITVYHDISDLHPAPDVVQGGIAWTFPVMDFRLDVELAAHRALTADEYERFKRGLGIGLRAGDRGTHGQSGSGWHQVYRNEVALGEEFLRSGLYPVKEYFAHCDARRVFPQRKQAPRGDELPRGGRPRYLARRETVSKTFGFLALAA
jgi:hypothetical protein